jgi:hypothetical protein
MTLKSILPSSWQVPQEFHDRLNLLAAFFFPIATLSAIFGANLKHGLEQVTAPAAFLAVMATGLALGALLMKFVARVPAGSEARNALQAKSGKRR